VAGPLMFLGALGFGAVYLRRRSETLATDGLSDEEQARLREILED
jgi:hypothetical protein